MKFEDLSRKGKCDVCNKDSEVVVFASSMGAVSFAYCKECCDKGLEPYGAMVAYISCAGHYPKDIHPSYISIIQNNLKELGISEEDFIADVDRSIKEMNEYYKSI